MMIRIMGAVMLVGGCGGFGFLMGLYYRKEIRILRILLKSIQEMEWELKYRLTPLPKLFAVAATVSDKKLQELYCNMESALDSGMYSEVSGCMNGFLHKMDFSFRCNKCLKELGKTLGRYDLDGQLQGLQAVKAQCRSYIEELESHRSERLRSYQTLGLCAGAALVILLV